jgi:hypothetical protein
MRSVIEALPLPPVYYYGPDYLFQDAAGKFIRVNESSAKRFLRDYGYAGKSDNESALSDVDKCLLDIQRSQNVAYAGRLAGHGAGLYLINGSQVLVTESPTLIQPRPGTFPLLQSIMDGMFIDEQKDQRPYVYGWLKKGLECYREQRWTPGQILAMAGPRCSGKSLFQGIVTQMFGGRSAKPYLCMAGKTTFNADLFQAEHLMIEDDAEFTDIKSRRHFGAALKQVAVNKTHQCHGKHKDGVGLTPLWRTSISLNDDTERLLVLPPIDDDIADKIILLKIGHKALPMATETAEEKEKFWNALVAELPAFIHFLQTWEIPVELRCPRFGIRHYHHPELLSALDEHTPETKVLELIDSEIFRFERRTVDLTSSELERKLTRDESSVAREAKLLFGYSSACGAYLGRLAKDWPERVTKRVLHGKTRWTIQPPPVEENHAATALKGVEGEGVDTFLNILDTKVVVEGVHTTATATARKQDVVFSVNPVTQSVSSEKPAGDSSTSASSTAHPVYCRTPEEALRFLGVSSVPSNDSINTKTP